MEMYVYVILRHQQYPFGMNRQWLKAGEIMGVFKTKESAESAKKKDTSFYMYTIEKKVLK